MKPLYTPTDFEKAKVEDLLPCECYQCKKTFYKQKRTINKVLKGISFHLGKFCSNTCLRKYNNFNELKTVNCSNCNSTFKKKPSEIKRTKHHFCSKSCSATYNNTHKAYGIRRSKLEMYLEEQLTLLYPNLKIDYNKTEAINSELDIYIPSMKLAFELNGIFHYEPIYGQKKLQQTQNNDQRKFQACIEKQISLCILDVSSLKYFKPERANKFLNIITEIINREIS